MEIPPYTIRISDRCKYLKLQVSYHGLEVVLPRGYDRSQIQDVLQTKQAWINKAFAKFSNVAHAPLPTQIHLQAIAQIWQISYAADQVQGEQHLILNTKIPAQAQALLRQWLLTTAQIYLPAQLKTISEDLHLPFARVTIRQQKSRWGSCSRQKNISLNYKLLFLPAPIVRYVLIHELCHTQELNHAPRFWQLVHKFEPNYKFYDRQLQQMWYQIPPWT